MANELQGMWTAKGLEKLARHAAGGTALVLRELALGDGGGSPAPAPAPSWTELTRQVWRGMVNGVQTSPDNASQVQVDAVIPLNIGGFFIREWGLYDAEGDMVAVGAHAEFYKPVISSGASAEIVERILLPIANAGAITLTIASQAVATQQFVQAQVKAHDESPTAHGDMVRRLEEHTHPHATEDAAGLVELATAAEVLTGTDAGRSVTPATLAQLLNNLTTPAQFANDKKAATTEFVQRAIGNVRGLNSFNASATLTLGDTGKLVTFFGTAAGQILTLPAANAVPAGVGFWIVNQASVPVQISRTAADTLNINTHSGALSAGGLTILPGDSVFVASNGASVWNVVGWSSNNLFPRQLGSSGYQLLPGGLILQWGRTVAAPLGGASSRIDNYTLPVTFPAAVLFLAGGASSEGGAGVGGWPKESRTTSQVAVGVYNSAASTQPVGSWFFAIGY